MSNVFYFLKQIHSFAGKILYFNLIAMMLIGFLEGAGILLLIPLIGMTGIVDINVDDIPFLTFFKFLRRHSSFMGII